MSDKELLELAAKAAGHANGSLARALPQNCGNGHCSCIECFALKVTVLPYMGKPEDKRRPYMPMTVYTDGVKRTKAIIVESME